MKVKTVLELFDLEIHQKKIGPDCHRLKTMVAKGMGSPRHATTGRCGLARVPNLRVCKHFCNLVVAHAGEEG